MARRLPQPTDRIRLADTQVSVSPFCIGRVTSPRTIAAAFEAGINHFFLTADMHWPVYEQSRVGLRRLLASRRGVRDDVVVSVACYVTQPDFCSVPFQEVIDSVPGLGHVDVAVMGGVYANDFLQRQAVHADHRQVRRYGVRAVGATFHERRLVPQATRGRLVDVAWTRYNPLHVGVRTEVFPELPRSTTVPLFGFNSTVGYVPPARRRELGVERTYWQPEVADYYRFALTRPQLRGLLCSPSTPGEVTALARALERGPLTTDEEQFLIDLARLDTGQVELATHA